MIKFTNVYKKYPNGHEALIRVNFHLQKGEMAFLTGYSGAGKSTFLSIAGSLEKATRGQVEVNDVDLMAIQKRAIPAFRRRVGIVLQNPHLLSEKTAFDNIALSLIISGMRKTEIGKKVDAALDKVNLLSKAQYLAAELSTGEQQRVALARAIVSKPDLLLADEPTGNLDPELSREILNLFTEFNQVGTSVLIATHDVALIKTLPYRIVNIEAGANGRGMMESLSNTLDFLLQTIFMFYMVILLIRIMLPSLQGDYHNQLAQFIVVMSNPLILPIRKLIYYHRKMDIAAIIVLLIITFAYIYLHVWLQSGYWIDLTAAIIWVIGTLLNLIVVILFWAIVINAILSWIATPQRDFFAPRLIADRLTAPLLSPLRRFIHPIGGIDITPVIMLIILRVIEVALVYPIVQAGVDLALGTN